MPSRKKMAKKIRCGRHVYTPKHHHVKNGQTNTDLENEHSSSGWGWRVTAVVPYTSGGDRWTQPIVHAHRTCM